MLSKRAAETKKKSNVKKSTDVIKSDDKSDRPFQTPSNPLLENDDREIEFPSSDEKSGL